jgi:hypothetical protein
MKLDEVDGLKEADSAWPSCAVRTSKSCGSDDEDAEAMSQTGTDVPKTGQSLWQCKEVLQSFFFSFA